MKNTLANYLKQAIQKVGQKLGMNPETTKKAIKRGGAIGGAGAVGYGLYKLLDKDEPTQTSTPTPTPQPKAQPKAQSQTKPQPKAQSQTKPDYEQMGLAFLKQIENLQDELAKYQQGLLQLGQEYQQEYENFKAFSEKYLNSINQINNHVLLYLGQKGLGQLLSDDLIEHLNSTLMYTPATQLGAKLQQVLKGYILARAEGLDTSKFSFEDLSEFASNPNILAKYNTDKNFMAGVEAMTTELSKAYQNNLTNLKMLLESKELQLNSMKTAITTLANIINEKGEMLRTLLQQDYLRDKLAIETALEREKLQLQKELINLKQQQQQQQGFPIDAFFSNKNILQNYAPQEGE